MPGPDPGRDRVGDAVDDEQGEGDQDERQVARVGQPPAVEVAAADGADHAVARPGHQEADRGDRRAGDRQPAGQLGRRLRPRHGVASAAAGWVASAGHGRRHRAPVRPETAPRRTGRVAGRRSGTPIRRPGPAGRRDRRDERGRRGEVGAGNRRAEGWPRQAASYPPGCGEPARDRRVCDLAGGSNPGDSGRTADDTGATAGRPGSAPPTGAGAARRWRRDRARLRRAGVELGGAPAAALTSRRRGRWARGSGGGGGIGAAGLAWPAGLAPLDGRLPASRRRDTTAAHWRPGRRTMGRRSASSARSDTSRSDRRRDPAARALQGGTLRGDSDHSPDGPPRRASVQATAAPGGERRRPGPGRPARRPRTGGRRATIRPIAAAARRCPGGRRGPSPMTSRAGRGRAPRIARRRGASRQDDARTPDGAGGPAGRRRRSRAPTDARPPRTTRAGRPARPTSRRPARPARSGRRPRAPDGDPEGDRRDEVGRQGQLLVHDLAQALDARSPSDDRRPAPG